MSRLFESSYIKTLQLPNRFVRSATWEGMADPDGSVTPRLIDTLVALARGEVGLIIAGHAYVRPEGQATPWQLGLHNDELLPGLRQLTAAVHAQGGRIAAQLAHAGTFAAEKLTGQMPWAVSEYDGLADSPRHEMTASDIQELVAAFAAAAARARTRASTRCSFIRPMATCSASSSPPSSTGAGTTTAAASATALGSTWKYSRPSGMPWGRIIRC